METVSAYIPVDRRHALHRRRLLPDRTGGAVLFADISGFTHLTNVLSGELGPQRGAEEISIQLDRIYSVMIARVHDYAGSVISFSGDAITCWFDDKPIGAEVAHNGAIRATACALAIQTVIKNLGGVRTPGGTTISVGVKVAVTAGITRRFLLGLTGEQRLEVLAGHLVDRTAAAEQLLTTGETAVGVEITLESDFGWRVTEWRTSESGERFAIISGFGPGVPPSPWSPIPDIETGIAGNWMLKPVYDRLQRLEGRFLAELRPVVVMFLSFGGINYERDDDAGQQLYDYIAWIQNVLSRYEGYLLQLIIGDKGSYCFIVFGALQAHEDDPSRAITVAAALNSPPRELEFIKEIRIGISQGVLHVGAYGSPNRRTFGVVGNETNIAARLMSMAQPTQILVTSNVAKRASRDFQFEEFGHHLLKGLAKPVSVLSVSGARRQAGAQSIPKAAPSQVIGRDAEMAFLRQKLQLLQGGESATVILSGDAGIGKSRLLAGLLDEARGAKVTALTGAGDAIEQATPYFAWRPVFRALFAVDESDTSEMVRETVLSQIPDDSDIRQLLPLLNTVLPLQISDNELTSQMSGEARANSTRAYLLRLLSILALSHGHLLLAFDDAHWLDSASAALLAQARRVLSPVLFLIVSRSGNAGNAAQTEYERLLDAPDVERLLLDTLSREDVVQLVCHRLGVTKLPATVASFIYGHSEGHPFFSEEIAYALRDAGYIRIENGLCFLANGNNDLRNLDFPVTIQGVVTSRIDRLDTSQQLTLKVASVLGRIFTVRVLGNIYPSAESAGQLPAQLSALERLDIILRETPPPDLSYIFKHNITQEVIYNLMTFSQRQQLHRSAAQWYENRYAEDLAAYYPLLAHHWTRAEDSKRAILYLEKAGEQALRNFANEEAVDFYMQALAVDAAAGFPSATQQRAEWELKIGEAYVHWTRYAEGRDHLERGLALLGAPVPYSQSPLNNTRHALQAMTRQLRHRLVPGRYLGARHAESDVLLAASRAYSRLVEVYFHSGETLRSIHAAFHTLNLAEIAGDSPELAEAYAPLGAFWSFIRLHGAANSYFQRALDVSTRVNSLSARSFVLLTKATYETGVGKWTEARQSIEELIDIGRRLGAQRRYNDGLQLQSILFYLLGEYRDCLAVGESLLTSARQLNDLRFQGYGLFACAFGHFHLGAVEVAVEQLEELNSLFSARNAVTDTQLAFLAHGLWCLVHLTRGDLSQALDAAGQAAQLAEGPFQASYWTLPGYAAVAETYLTAWELDHSFTNLEHQTAQSVKALKRYGRTFPIGSASAHLYQGWQQLLCGKRRQAFHSWQRGLQAALAMELHYEAGRLNYELGRSRPARDSGAPSEFVQAHAHFLKVGAAFGLQAAQNALDHSADDIPPLFTRASTD